MSQARATVAPIRLAVHGASGRMGQLLVQQAAEDPRFNLQAALVRAESSKIGQPLPNSALCYQSEWPESLDLIIDFSLPEAFSDVLSAAERVGAALISGTTGLSLQQHQALIDFAQRGKALWASNFSLGAAVLAELASQARHLLPAAFDAAIFEAHHNQKLDAPSGTALSIGRAMHAVDAVEPSYAALRAGRIVGEHTVFLAGPFERLELTHRADDRRVFAYGALAAGAWLVHQSPGLYQVRDWLFGSAVPGHAVEVTRRGAGRDA